MDDLHQLLNILVNLNKDLQLHFLLKNYQNLLYARFNDYIFFYLKILLILSLEKYLEIYT